jgi:ferredoxin
MVNPVYRRIYYIRFPKEISDKPIIYQLIKQYDVEVNILRADILPQREGILILELAGAKPNITDGLNYLEEHGLSIERLATKIRRDDERCFQCGACTGVCPVDALYIRREDMAVLFDADKCTGCSQCVLICPVRAMEMSLGKEWLEPEADRTNAPLFS